MFCRGVRAYFFAFICASFFAGTVMADDCKLARIADLNVQLSRGKIFVPVSIEGASRLMALDTGAPLSAVDPQAAADLKLVTHRIYQGVLFDVTGKQFTEMAVVHTLGIGDMRTQNAHLLVWPSRMSDDPQMGGTLAADLLRHYDVDLDFANRKVGLFSQDHCPGKVVYWQAQAVAVIPMRVVSSGHIIVPVMLDGRQFDAVLDTGSYNTYLSLEAAQRVYGLTPDSPELQRIKGADGPNSIPVYRHTFSTLTLEGISIANPPVYIWHDVTKYSLASQSPAGGWRFRDADESGGMTDMILGLHELRNLHVYIAYEEQKIYVTPSGADPAAAGNSGSPSETQTDLPNTPH
jgi:predicted aspartyl protease